MRLNSYNIFNIEYSIPGLQKWLHRNKFSYKQFKGVPHKYDQGKQDATVNDGSIIDFFKQIKEQYVADKPIHLILDGAGYHRSNVVKVKQKRWASYCIIYRLIAQI